MQAIEIEPCESAKPEDPDQTGNDELSSVPKGSWLVATGRSVSFSSGTQDPDLYPGSDTEPDEVAPPPSAPSPPPVVPPVSPLSRPSPSHNPLLPSPHALITSTHSPVPSKNPNHCPLTSTPKD
ncbi:hypothetical protein L873DRAFT_1846349 [Choiromyces venosus 120613-1]|uniref:Uncharacterized protein n=1 Tax=Choiromyces venosus 120613-1 TaxID=1336337 RepID=A0A3N4J8Y9_9PEZI|nr:hypothetical protein L873DRAFT_1846349 [Choiromyces venosus 120613-1]